MRFALLRHLLAIVALPFMVAVVIPSWLAWRNPSVIRMREAPVIVAQVAGILMFGVGLWMFLRSVRGFAKEGEGTLAPWDPPRRLVVTGLYRHVRNPMISGVLFMLLGEALALWSAAHFRWALLFFIVNAIYIPLLEEPQLAARFGEEYREYCRRVPRLIPRLRPWRG